MATPRTAADLHGGDGRDVLAGRARVVNRNGEEVTVNFIRGAEQVILLARSLEIETVFLKARSPSCGLRPLGVTAALLEAQGYRLEEF